MFAGLKSVVEAKAKNFPYLEGSHCIVVVDGLEDQVSSEKIVDLHLQVHGIIDIDILWIFEVVGVEVQNIFHRHILDNTEFAISRNRST